NDRLSGFAHRNPAAIGWVLVSQKPRVLDRAPGTNHLVTSLQVYPPVPPKLAGAICRSRSEATRLIDTMAEVEKPGRGGPAIPPLGHPWSYSAPRRKRLGERSLQVRLAKRRPHPEPLRSRSVRYSAPRWTCA